MTDVRDNPTQTAANDDAGTNPIGDFIWYELMTPDPEGSKAFYDAVVGWNVGAAEQAYNGYRMIARRDGGFAGGFLPLTADMQSHGAFPTWLGYIFVDDVDKKVAAVEAAGGKAWMPATDIPNVGRVALVSDPQAAPFYIMKPIPPSGDPNAKSDVFSPDAEQRVGWNELSTTDPVAARSFYEQQFGWGTDQFMDMGELGEYRFLEQNGIRIGALCGVMPGGKSKWRYYIRVPSISKAKETAEARGATIYMGPHQVPTGDYIIIGSDPQGAEFALVGGE
jgi:predicted enzyme related to lactoylglutathione lyase